MAKTIKAYKLFLVHFSVSVQFVRLFGDACWKQLCTNSLLIVSQVHTVCTLWKHDYMIECYGLVRLYFNPIYTMQHINRIQAVFPYGFCPGHFFKTPNTISTAAWFQSGDRSDPVIHHYCIRTVTSNFKFWKLIITYQCLQGEAAVSAGQEHFASVCFCYFDIFLFTIEPKPMQANKKVKVKCFQQLQHILLKNITLSIRSCYKWIIS